MPFRLSLDRIYYGWVLVVVLAVTETVSYGVLSYTFTVFVKPMQGELHWKNTDISGAFFLSLMVSALVGVPLGRWLDRRGPRWSMTAGSVASVLLVLLWSTARDLPAFYAIWFGLGVTKAMVLYEPAFWIVANWFLRQRRLALTVMTFIAGFSSLIFIPLAQSLVAQLGWRNALIALAIILATITIPLHLLVLRRRPSDLGLHLDGAATTPSGNPTTVTSPTQDLIPASKTIRSSAFWWLTAAFALTDVVHGFIAVQIVPFLTDLGHDAAFAALAAGMIGAASLPGRIIFTLSGSRWSPGGIAALLFALQTLALMTLLNAHTSASVFVFVALYGAGFGAITPARAGLIAEFFGRKAYGVISGILGLCVTLISATASILATSIIDRTKSYDGIVQVMIIVSAISVVMILLANHVRYSQRVALEST